MKITKTLVNLVHDEAMKLKQHATKTELSRIAFSKLEPTNAYSCIYGQATGDCFSERATELIRQCAAKVYDWEHAMVWAWNDEAGRIGKKAGIHPYERVVYSPIETYIALDGADNQQLVRYLKGKIDTLDLTHTISN